MSLGLPLSLSATPAMLSLPSHATSAGGHQLANTGISEILYNPAGVYGMVHSSRWQSHLGYQRLPLGTAAFHAAYAGEHFIPGVIGLGVAHFTAGSLDLIDASGNAAGAASVNASQFYVHWSGETLYGMIAGVNLKFFRSDLAGFGAIAGVSDFSLRREFAFDQVTLYAAALARNVGTPISYDAGSETLPSEFSSGLGINAPLFNKFSGSLVVYGTHSLETGGSVEPGMELGYSIASSRILLRSSMIIREGQTLLRYGAGLDSVYRNYGLEISFMGEPSPIEGMNYFISATFREVPPGKTEVVKPGFTSDLEKALRLNEYINDHPSATTELAEYMRLAGIKYGDLSPQNGSFVLLGFLNPRKLIYIPFDESRMTHTIITREGSQFKGSIREAAGGVIVLRFPTGSELRIPHDRIMTIRDDTLNF